MAYPVKLPEDEYKEKNHASTDESTESLQRENKLTFGVLLCNIGNKRTVKQHLQTHKIVQSEDRSLQSMRFQTLIPNFPEYGLYFCLHFIYIVLSQKKVSTKEFGGKGLWGEWLINWCLFFVELGRKSLNTTQLIFISVLAMIY